GGNRRVGRAGTDLQWRPRASADEWRPRPGGPGAHRRSCPCGAPRLKDMDRGTQAADIELPGRESVAGDTYDRMKKIVVEQLGVEEDEVKPEASFVDDLNADSLDLVELIMSLEEEFGTEISDEDAEKIRTVQDAADYIDEHSS